MANRTTPIAVSKILGNNFVADCSVSELLPYIETANEMVSQVASCATAQGTPHTTARLELIERWLAAYYYTVMDPIYTSKSTDGSSGSFEQRSYMKVAQQLDGTGCLKAAVEGGYMQIAWVGKTPSEQTAYWDRD